MPDVVFYNSLTKQVEPFTPQEPGKVRLYNCGPTVYKRQHLGNMRRFLFADFLRRTLEFFGYEVREITNITDVGHLTQDEIDAGEDKIAKAAREAKTTPQDIAEAQTKLFLEDIAALNIQAAHQYPRATAHIEHMQRLIQQLLDSQHAYQTSTGIYFNIQSFPSYGKLSGNTLEALQAGKRIAVREEKKHPADFTLWVFYDKALQRWPSPWGTGYPGWHIECSAMSMEYLGSTLDIHTGGEDNRFPHHENEIAQSEAATGKPFVKYWLHNRHLQLSGTKLAKREGQQLTIDTLREHNIDPLAFRLFVFASHYRNLLNFSWEDVQIFQDHLESLKQLLRRLQERLGSQPPTASADSTVIDAFKAALADDLNTPAAWAEFLSYVKTINAALDDPNTPLPTLALHHATLIALDKILGVLESLQKQLSNESAPADIQQLADDRDLARHNKDFPEADRLRDIIEQHGYTIEDTSSGPRVKKK